ncbi:beta-lactamase [Beutenbergia cavernae DSM 12333]|uniref:Beta-lactamase n=1 Tax=Beutenbergia cavernae (strain ATCC BAA-8 / DSM 12333 / CCUG 43141 / JCM 11478 / NBRC 16432 / NCIMB 13614 / HKI 0122) TaxID=471853 RepID=C5BVM6_BEUC1|nr:serine hydrolase domain-containing protein [Beutenbergia cavernae]ACQ78466.1 beta-lactamase [Beutenbergia cavernae DSM 12333]
MTTDDKGAVVPRDVETVAAELEQRVPRLLAEHAIPGVAIGVCDASRILWSAGFGTTTADGSQPITTDTTFGLQSGSKMYTATAVLRAVGDGLVDLDAPITDYLPDFRVRTRFEPNPERRITLRHLLAHTAGFTHEAPVGNNYVVGNASFAAHCRSIGDTWLRFDVGHHHEYSNLGYDLAGHVLERVSGEPFHRHLERALLEPLGLARTTADVATLKADRDHALGHGTSARVPFRVPMVPAGGVHASVDDACRFAQLHLRGGADLLPSELAEEMTAVPGHPERDQGYGLGVALIRVGDLVIRGHSGGGFGFLSDIYWAPEAGLGVVVLTNSTKHPLQFRLATEILRDLTGADLAPRPAAPTAHPDGGPRPPAAIAGEYVGRVGTLTLAVDGDGVVVRSGGTSRSARLVTPHELAVDGDSPQRYVLRDVDADGRPGMLESAIDGQVHHRNDPPPDAEPTASGPWNRDYSIRDGTAVTRTRLRHEGGLASIDWEGHRLQLERHTDDVWFSSTGEALDLASQPPTYANVRLHPR